MFKPDARAADQWSTVQMYRVASFLVIPVLLVLVVAGWSARSSDDMPGRRAATVERAESLRESYADAAKLALLPVRGAVPSGWAQAPLRYAFFAGPRRLGATTPIAYVERLGDDQDAAVQGAAVYAGRSDAEGYAYGEAFASTALGLQATAVRGVRSARGDEPARIRERMVVQTEVGAFEANVVMDAADARVALPMARRIVTDVLQAG